MQRALEGMKPIFDAQQLQQRMSMSSNATTGGGDDTLRRMMEDAVDSLRERLAAAEARAQDLERALKAAEAEARSAALDGVERKRADAERVQIQDRLEHLL